ncbi:MAG: glutathione peroxidase [Flavobacteriia bacterium]|nr:glutathione peroxidase [Flavobacteriia bacterium]
MKYLIPILIAASVACSNAGEQSTQVAENTTAVSTPEIPSMSFYDFEVTDLEGETFDFESLKGKRVLIVNTASECGYTPQYAQLQELYEEYGGDSFTIVGFPANNFGGQEPGSDAEIRSFCSKNYGVSFPMMSKISVKGDDMHSLYHWLTEAEMNGVSDANVQWNFHKFLIDEDGTWIASHPSSVTPLDEKIVSFAKGE